MHEFTHYCTTVWIHLQALFLNSFFIMKTSLEKDIFNEMIIAHEIPFHMLPKSMELYINWLGYQFYFPWPCFTNTESILYRGQHVNIAAASAPVFLPFFTCSTESFLFKSVSAVTVLCSWCLFVSSVEIFCKLGEFWTFVSTLAPRIF